MKIESEEFKTISNEFYGFLMENNLINKNIGMTNVLWEKIEKIVATRLQDRGIAINLNK